MSYKEDVRLVKALTDENRLIILELLQSGEKCGCTILEELKITQPTLSHHMKILCDSGLVDSRKDGKWTYYALSLEGSNNLIDLAKHYTVNEDEYKNYKKCDPCTAK